MSGLDETLARWRSETERLEPSAALMVELNALAVAQTTASTASAVSAAPPVAAKAAGVTKAVLLVVAVALLGIAGAVLLSVFSPAPTPVPCEACAQTSLAAEPAVTGPTAMAEPLVPGPAMIVAAPVVRERSSADPKTPVPAIAAAPVVRERSSADPKTPVPTIVAVPVVRERSSTDPKTLVPADPPPSSRPLNPPAPARLVRATEGLAMTCAAQRNVLVELVREAAAEDPEAAAAALTRWTLLCRALSGPALDGHRWFWPWAAPSGTGSTCKTLISEASCADGDNITQSIAAAAQCVRDTTPGSCARRGALLQAVFASCEAFTHRSEAKNRGGVDEALSRLTDEFGAGLAPAAWCLNPAAKAEALRRR